MNNINLSTNLNFNNLHFDTYHHTDNSVCGAAYNYVALMLKGEAKIVSDNLAIEVKEGDVFYIPKNLKYHSYWYGDSEINFLSIGFIDLNINEKHSYKLQVIDCDNNVKEAIRNIETNGTNISCKALSVFYDVMSGILPLLIRADGNEKQLIEKAKKLILGNPVLSNSEISKCCSISAPYLYLLFNKFEGITPNAYRQKILCNMATELLITTDKSIEQISDELNFSSSSYFRKIIKKHLGTTPRQIRKKHLM